ncbi:MAG: hypothetical protein K2M75_06045 [Clostridia bacterium]|nr:hypothetical protein [Clostridia bacterium]
MSGEELIMEQINVAQTQTDVLIIQTVAVAIATLVAALTLFFSIRKERIVAKSKPTRSYLEYEDEFGDLIANYGVGIMEIKSIEILYDGQLTNYDALYKLYEDKLGVGEDELTWDTYLDNEELLNRVIGSQAELEVAKIDPSSEENVIVYGATNLLAQLRKIRKLVTIKITYKEMYGREKEIKL